MAAFRKSSRSSGLARLLVAGAACASGAWLCTPSTSFAGGLVTAPSTRVVMAAEAAPAPAAPAPAPAGSSTALIKVTEENVVTSASVLGGLAGLLVGGVWVGAGLFAVSSYLARKEDDDISMALKGVTSSTLEALNFTASINEKYSVTDTVGGAITSAVDGAKSGSASNKEALDTVGGLVDSAKEALDSVDKDVGIKDTAGSLLMSASDLASQAVEKAIELNDQYKLTDQLVEKVEEVTNKAKTSAAAK